MDESLLYYSVLRINVSYLTDIDRSDSFGCIQAKEEHTVTSVLIFGTICDPKSLAMSLVVKAGL